MAICWQLPVLLIVALVGGALAQIAGLLFHRRHHGKQ